MPKLKALLIDLSGTLHTGDRPTPGAVEALRRLRGEGGVLLRFCSNTTKESKSSLLERLKKIDLDVRPEELFTSLAAVKELVEKERLKPLLLLSESALSDFSSLPSSASTPPVPPEQLDAVVLGLAPSELDYRRLNQGFRLLIDEGGKKGEGGGRRRLIATHKALYFRDEDGGLSLGPGGFVSALEEASGVKAEVVGKPSESFFTITLESLEKEGISRDDWSHVGMVGDDKVQDIGQGAASLGLQRFLVKTGKYREGDEGKVEGGGPTGVFENFAELVDWILDKKEA